jgi:hypothetical protein
MSFFFFPVLFFLFFFVFLFFLNKIIRGAYYFCYLFDRKIDEGLRFKLTVNLGLKICKVGNWGLKVKIGWSTRGFHHIFPWNYYYLWWYSPEAFNPCRPLFASSLLGIVRILLEQTRQDEMQISGCSILVDFINSKVHNIERWKFDLFWVILT